MSAIVILSSILFVLGILGLLVRRNLLFILLSIEVMLNAVAFAFVAVSCQMGNADGQVMFLLISSIAAAEIGIGLALLIAHDRIFKTIDVG